MPRLLSEAEKEHRRRAGVLWPFDKLRVSDKLRTFAPTNDNSTTTMSNGTVATNRRARHDYFIEDILEAGLELRGAEVKSLREHHVSIQEAHAAVADGQVWLYNMHVAAYKPAAHERIDPYRRRRLLLHRSEIRRLDRAVQQKGYTLIPLKIYFNERGLAKVQLGLCKGKRQYDKREAIKERDFQRRAERALREHQQRE